MARKHALPDAVSQLKVKTAAYGEGALVTGGTRIIRLCRAGTLMPLSTVVLFGRNEGIRPFVQRSSAPLIDGSPHASTNTTSSRYGAQAMTISPAVCFDSA